VDLVSVVNIDIMAAPKKQQLAGSGIALCGMAWGLLFFAAIFIAGALQQSIETDAAQCGFRFIADSP
jgi:hypothetical protein